MKSPTTPDLAPAPVASVIVINWNGKHFLPDCLQGLRQQTFQDFEILFVDNGSTDGSLSWVQNNYPEILCIPLDHNTGFVGANLIGDDQARGRELIVLLNNDTLPEPGWLELVS